MSSLTPNYSFVLPAVGSAVDEDLWGSELNSNWSAIDTDLKTVSDTATAAAAAVAALQLPIGSLYFNAAVATNPASLLGYGTWTAFGAGRVIIGVGTGTDSNGHMQTFSNGDTGGEYQHTQTEGELASHAHAITYRTGSGSSTGYNIVSSSAVSSSPITNSGTSSDGSSTPMPWLQPYITVYCWKRTA